MLTFDSTDKRYFELRRIPNNDETEIYFRFRQNPSILERPYDLLIILKSKAYGADYKYNRNHLRGILLFLRNLNSANIHIETGLFKNCSSTPNPENYNEVDTLETSMPEGLNWEEVIDEAMDCL